MKVLTLCLVNTFCECHYKPNLSCEVRGAGGLCLRQNEREGPSEGTNGFRRGVLIAVLCVLCALYLAGRGHHGASKPNEFHWKRGLRGSFYSNPFKCIHVFRSVFAPSIHIQMFSVRKFVAILSPNCQFCQLFATRFLHQYLCFETLTILFTVWY